MADGYKSKSGRLHSSRLMSDRGDHADSDLVAFLRSEPNLVDSLSLSRWPSAAPPLVF